jgi:hypothetical protein
MATKYELPWNPWRVLDLQRARAADSWTYPHEKQMIMNAYRDCQPPEPCPGEGCKDKLYWRDTVSVMMCPSCRMMRLGNGDLVVASGYTPEWSA